MINVCKVRGMKQKTCIVSGEDFVVADKDQVFYQRMGVPQPVLCPDERQRRRLAWRNQRKLYRRECDGSDKPILSIFPPDYPGVVYSPEKYWADDWDGRDYGRDFDFSRPFFPQFMELFYATPQLARQAALIENCDYVNDVLRLKDCYLVFDGEQARDTMYGETFMHLTDCVDFLFLTGSELCYECTNCDNGYRLCFAHNCVNCQESWFLRDCVGCKNCFGCIGLHNKQYWIYNKPHTKEQYEEFLSGFESGKYSVVSKLREQSKSAWSTATVKSLSGKQNDNVTGDYLEQCKDCEECYDCKKLRDCKYCTNVLVGAQDCYDLNVWGNQVSLCCDSATLGEGIQDVIGSFWIAMGGERIAHSAFCFNNCKNLLGCVGLKKAEYCILNKQYTKEEYENLWPKIVAHMKETGEWGEFFPIELSPFSYNCTAAQEYFPLTSEEALAKGYKWEEEKVFELPGDRVTTIPDDIADVDDAILEQTLVCENTGKPYRLTKPELQFYRQMKLPVPRLHPDERHRQRMSLRNPRKLYDRRCAECGQVLKTTYAPDQTEKVLCEDCYLSQIV